MSNTWHLPLVPFKITLINSNAFDGRISEAHQKIKETIINVKTQAPYVQFRVFRFSSLSRYSKPEPYPFKNPHGFETRHGSLLRNLFYLSGKVKFGEGKGKKHSF
jgi:hypothetical protein